ncbi:MAG TPA: molecular chaperone HtpG [Bacteroidia bacterium]|nr:molecular chaperone HtpG [Bacteroidia bacterium]HNT79307.1 molecular chaperone HtpG [Bacteroidia bacterium]
MTTQSGKINVHTENIFPIIKKFLYSDHEIFLRELVSNAVDASRKMDIISRSGDFKGERGNNGIQISLNKENKTLTISDHGLGMTADEVEKYINQIAFSSAEDFVEKYKNESEGNPVIGHFGLGFYSAFMVADKVELISKSYVENSSPVKWTCTGNTDFTLEETTRDSFGTDVILHINSESEEFLESVRIKTLLKKYCTFLPIEISFENEIINNTQATWLKAPSELKEEDYKNFYKELYPIAEDPLFHIHLNVDYPFKLTGILYFPKINRNIELQKNKIQLYCNQVFVTDSVEGIVPEFLTLMHGVIDSPDIPLNVSRSYLQSDANVKKISSHISKKVADKLKELFKEDRTAYEQKWDDIGLFVKYGMLTDEKFSEQINDCVLLKNTEAKFFTLSEYRELIKSNQENKTGEVIYLYANHTDQQHSYIQQCKNRGYDVLEMGGQLDMHFVNMLESKEEKSRFKRVDAEAIDKLIEKDLERSSLLNDDQKKLVASEIEKCVSKDVYHISFENLDKDDMPFTIVQPEFLRRMKEMSAAGGPMPFMGNMPETYSLIVNTNHPVVLKLSSNTDEKSNMALIQNGIDLARLQQNLLKGSELTAFIQRSLDAMND